MNTIGKLQFLSANFKSVIRDIQNDIVLYKQQKRIADESGILEAEYAYHNLLKAARKELKKWVEMQMDCKAALREEYAFNAYGKQLAKQDKGE